MSIINSKKFIKLTRIIISIQLYTFGVKNNILNNDTHLLISKIKDMQLVILPVQQIYLSRSCKFVGI